MSEAVPVLLLGFQAGFRRWLDVHTGQLEKTWTQSWPPVEPVNENQMGIWLKPALGEDVCSQPKSNLISLALPWGCLIVIPWTGLVGVRNRRKRYQHHNKSRDFEELP